MLGYDIDVTDSTLGVVLHWQALRRMDTAFKFFVHVRNMQTDELVAQVDTMPRGWTYPTTWWEEGEIVSDLLELPLVEMASGTYELTIGVYDPDSLERLPVRQFADGPLIGDALVLEETITISASER